MNIQEVHSDNDAYSAWKASSHAKEIDALRKGEVFAPKCIQVDLEGFCPHDCNFCAYRVAGWNTKGMSFFDPKWAPDHSKPVKLEQESLPKGRIIEGVSGMPREIAIKLGEQMVQAGIPSIELTGGGEPTIHPYFDEVVDMLIKFEREIGLVTNGQLLSRKRVDKMNGDLRWLRFSIDAATPETYSKVHGVHEKTWAIVLQNLSYAIERKTKVNKLGVSFIVNPANLHEMIQATQFFKDLGVDNIRFSFVYDPEGKGRLTTGEVSLIQESLKSCSSLANDKFKVFGSFDRLGTYSMPNTDFNFCGYQLFTWAIGYDCLVYPCCIQKYNKPYAFGDLRKHTLEEIVNSRGRKEYIKQFNVKACNPCWLRERNKFIEYLVVTKPIHNNFV